MPWKGESNPYLIWLSEIILQQTRVEQGWDYYLIFKERFPDVFSMADASEDEILKLWQGLGYYSRARNMHATARKIATEYDGKFPADFDSILSLKGIGDYTASAIASFAFGIPQAVVDGNVVRVLSRYFDLEEPFRQQSKAFFKSIAQAVLPRDEPGRFNQAIMDFGALVCTPAKPDCAKCPLSSRCAALANGTVSQRPVRLPKKARRERHFHFLDIRYADELVLEQRGTDDIWKKLYQFPLVESQGWLDAAEAIAQAGMPEPDEIQATSNLKHELTHQRIHARFYRLTYINRPELSESRYFWSEKAEIANFALPKLMDSYLNHDSHQLLF